MPEIRRNPLTGVHVVVAPERSKRPARVRLLDQTVPGGTCPFCAGNESATPPAIVTCVDRETNAWTLRVIPNRYPALQVEAEGVDHAAGPYDRIAGVGAHEVIIESPLHDADAPDMSVGAWRQVFAAWQARTADLAGDQRLAHVQVFRNRGALAGATLEHPHSQLIATPVVPGGVQAEFDRARAWQQTRGRALLDDIVDYEVEDGARVLFADANVVVFCPWASRFAFETWIVPRERAPRFEQASSTSRDSVADATRDAIRRVLRATSGAGYNLLVQNAPLRVADVSPWRWHVRLQPRGGRIAGFEWATGDAINATPPEDAAEFLRGVS